VNPVGPVAWAAYMPAVQSYQGEVSNKADIFDRFMHDTANDRDDVDYKVRFPELNAVWQHIFVLVPSLWFASSYDKDVDNA